MLLGAPGIATRSKKLLDVPQLFVFDVHLLPSPPAPMLGVLQSTSEDVYQLHSNEKAFCAVLHSGGASACRRRSFHGRGVVGRRVREVVSEALE